jgi:hypothetical protein
MDRRFKHDVSKSYRSPSRAPTRGEQNIDNFAVRAPGNGARIRNLRAESSRNQESLLIWSTKMRSREQLRWGHHGGGTKVAPGPAKAQTVYCSSSIENPLSLMPLVKNTHFSSTVGDSVSYALDSTPCARSELAPAEASKKCVQRDREALQEVLVWASIRCR